MSRRFEGKAAIVTGGTSGIGRSTCIAFAREGARVTVVGRNEERGHNVVTECRQVGGEGLFVRADVSMAEDAHKVVQQTEKALGRIDFLVNNAANFTGTAETIVGWERSFGVNVFGAAVLAREVAGVMKGFGKGSIVNVSSVSGHVAQPDHWTYNSSKGALNTLTKCMALDLARWGIRVNSLSAGWIWTPPTAATVGGDRERMDTLTALFQMIPRCGEPEEVAAAILFLCSDDASFITAADLVVDGGYLGMGPEGPGRDLSDGL